MRERLVELGPLELPVEVRRRGAAGTGGTPPAGSRGRPARAEAPCAASRGRGRSSCATAFSFIPTSSPISAYERSSSSRSARTSRWRGSSRAFATRTSSCCAAQEALRSGSSSIGCRHVGLGHFGGRLRALAALDLLEEEVTQSSRRGTALRSTVSGSSRSSAGSGADERLLDEIVRVVHVARRGGSANAAQPRLVLGVKLLPGRAVAGLEPPDERGVRPRRRGRHRPNRDGFGGNRRKRRGTRAAARGRRCPRRPTRGATRRRPRPCCRCPFMLASSARRPTHAERPRPRSGPSDVTVAETRNFR